MKKYHPLIIPEDSAWNRKTLSARIWRNLNWRIRDFLTGCKNIIKWAPTIWKDRDWDNWYILNILQKKIEFQRKEIIYSNRHTRVEEDNRDMTIALNLIERIKEGYYETEYLEYEDSHFFFKDTEDNPNVKELDLTIEAERYDEYLSKYRSTVRKVLKEKSDLGKRDLCFWVARENHSKAQSLLFRILENKMPGWWD